MVETDIAQASSRLMTAQQTASRSAKRLEKARSELAALTDSGAGRAQRVEATLKVEDLETELQGAKDRVSEAEAALARLRDAQTADRLEHLGKDLASAAAEIDVVMIELVKKFDRHRSVMLGIAKLSPGLARVLMAQHQRTLIARSAAQHHGLDRFMHLEHRVVAHGVAPFASASCPQLEAEVRRLRGGDPAEEAA